MDNKLSKEVYLPKVEAEIGLAPQEQLTFNLITHPNTFLAP